MDRKFGEYKNLVSRIKQDTVTCDLTSITNPLDEALRTRFICSMSNEAVLKALSKIKDLDLTFTKAIEITTEIEDAAKVAKETLHETGPSTVNSVHKLKLTNVNTIKKFTCVRCNGKGHKAPDCIYKNSKCN